MSSFSGRVWQQVSKNPHKVFKFLSDLRCQKQELSWTSWKNTKGTRQSIRQVNMNQGLDMSRGGILGILVLDQGYQWQLIFQQWSEPLKSFIKVLLSSLRVFAAVSISCQATRKRRLTIVTELWEPYNLWIIIMSRLLHVALNDIDVFDSYTVNVSTLLRVTKSTIWCRVASRMCKSFS